MGTRRLPVARGCGEKAPAADLYSQPQDNLIESKTIIVVIGEADFKFGVGAAARKLPWRQAGQWRHPPLGAAKRNGDPRLRRSNTSSKSSGIARVRHYGSLTWAVP